MPEVPLLWKVAEYSLAAGGEKDEKHKIPVSGRLERLLFVEKGGLPLENVTVSVWYEERPLTRDEVPASVYGSTPWWSLEIGLDVEKNRELRIGIKNNYSESRDIVIVAVIRTAELPGP